MAIIMGKGCLEAIYGLMGWKGLTCYMILSSRWHVVNTYIVTSLAWTRGVSPCLFANERRWLQWSP